MQKKNLLGLILTLLIVADIRVTDKRYSGFLNEKDVK